MIRPSDISISIYQTYVVSSENAPQEVFIDAIKIVKNVKLQVIYKKPVLYCVYQGGTTFTAGMALAHFRILNNVLMNKDTYVVP